MKFKFLIIVSMLFFVLAACQNADDNNQETGTGTGNNVEQTRNNTGDGMVGDRNHMMSRDSERFQDRDSGQNAENNSNKQYDVSEEAAELIANEVNEVDRAYVLSTDNNAYVAATLKNNEGNNNGNNGNNQENELSDEVKGQIGDIVRSVNNDIENVYVSTNPDFVDLTNNYVNDVDNGEPIEGFFDQMGTMIERIFPQNR
ncbi:YhcN/YlaJ family sporulation lipoprotein [Oceanobacillus massiliensis]|uniref:YhcN/YlaJ family sporulation lipoprotein n=1 Tax=Oceanobacillus massiliensis TaxID=1465765 RepID=UPI0030181098